MEQEAHGFSQRLRALDESEQRYKDENWSLETQTHELIASAKEAADREQRLHLTLSALTSEKSASQREIDDIKQANGRLVDDHAMLRKAHESELVNLRKNLSSREADTLALQRKVDELTSQNQELAKAMAGRFKDEEDTPLRDVGSEPEDMYLDRSEPEHSPPPSPTKGASRHTMLESETLKSSLHHAHRMIQNLKSNIHREKTEKLELKRMLQEARDELELRRSETGATNGSKRLKGKSQPDMSKKTARPSVLGAGRYSRTDITSEDAGWEDHNGEASPINTGKSISEGAGSDVGVPKHTNFRDAYQTANETEDAFETANERDNTTESEAFQTGAESMAGDSSDELTETEGGIGRGGTVREKRPSRLAIARAGDRSSIVSTASTSADDDDREPNSPLQTHPQRYRLKVNRGSRWSRIGSEGPTSSNPSSIKNSPASLMSTGKQPGQSLFAELGEMNGNESDGEALVTPSKSSIRSRRSISSITASAIEQDRPPPIPQLPMVDSGMMTEDWKPSIERQSAESQSSNALHVTPHSKDVGVQRTPTSDLHLVSASTSMSTPPRPAWGQPWDNFVTAIPTFESASMGPALTTSPLSPNSVSSRGIPFEDTASSRVDTSPPRSSPYDFCKDPPAPDLESRSTQNTLLSSPTKLGFSLIQSLDTRPAESPLPVMSKHAHTATEDREQPDSTMLEPQAQVAHVSKGGILDSVLGWTKNKRMSAPRIAEDETSGDFTSQTTRESKMPFQEIQANVIRPSTIGPSIAGPIEKSDQSSQTVLSAEQLEILIAGIDRRQPSQPSEAERRSPGTRMMKPLSDIGAMSPLLQNGRSEESINSNMKSNSKVSEPSAVREANPLLKTLQRPSSSGNMRATPAAYPPLPPDHRQAIAAAAQRAPSLESLPSVMGPPLVPASAYRSASNRPRTPSEQRMMTPTSRGGTTPRPRYSTARSQMSRRSSTASFGSELDERFNIRTDGMPMPQGLDNGTDPRMIQAITQTMIGEFLWKYTRKAGRGDMSDNRHRRFFWVHPYTRTLYWSDRDPSTAGRAELKAKSVAIQAVRVVTDDNPMPPGLHRKSLVIITPGRAVKFTAATSQRHETWFNALSYLLLRTGPDGVPTNGNDLTAEDVAEFNPPSSRRNRAESRLSLASYTSRATRNTSRERAESSLSTRQPPPAVQNSTSSRHSKQPSGSMSSRFSTYWRPHRNSSAHGSISSTRSKSGVRGASSVYESSVVHDSAEDLRQVIEKQEQEADRLENVRACCDGKSYCGLPKGQLLCLVLTLVVTLGRHDVGTLGNGKHGSHASRHSHAHTHEG